MNEVFELTYDRISLKKDFLVPVVDLEGSSRYTFSPPCSENALELTSDSFKNRGRYKRPIQSAGLPELYVVPQ